MSLPEDRNGKGWIVDSDVEFMSSPNFEEEKRENHSLLRRIGCNHDGRYIGNSSERSQLYYARMCCCPQTKEVSGPILGMPGPIGLFGFGSTVLISNIAVAGFCERNCLIDFVAIFFGGVVQFFCGFHELINKNAVGGITATGYGAYNMVNGFANVIPSSGSVSSSFKGSYFFVWMFFALTVLLMNCRGPSIVGTVLNAAVVVNFLLNAMGSWLNNQHIIYAAGYEGFFVGSLALYMSFGFSQRAAHQKTFVPLIFHEKYKNFRL